MKRFRSETKTAEQVIEPYIERVLHLVEGEGGREREGEGGRDIEREKKKEETDKKYQPRNALSTLF